ncbi:MAG: formate dehydrogenase [Betaproteobacteria bacterium]|nr:formate dehydrogenase [Betaproteobacteria bacterium]
MDGEHLYKMANQIGAFFAAQAGRAEAIEGIANHLKRFWDPRMRKQIVRMVDDKEAGLQPLVEDAIRAHRKLLVGLQRTS